MLPFATLHPLDEVIGKIDYSKRTSITATGRDLLNGKMIGDERKGKIQRSRFVWIVGRHYRDCAQ
jgi:hypothetical protein